MLSIYKQQIATLSDAVYEWDCCRLLIYKYNLMCLNANTQAGNKLIAMQAFREAVTFEIDEDYDYDQQGFAFLLDDFDGMPYLTKKRLQHTSDNKIWGMLKASLEGIETKLCDGCGDQEEMPGDFKRCAGCTKAFYCTKTCQRQHWKLHKATCKGKHKGCQVTAKELKSVAMILIQNYTKTVEKHSTTAVVSDDQKKAAFPGLVELLKEFASHRTKFNLDATFGNANHDPEFNQSLEDFFTQQPGYKEPLRIIYQNPEIQAYKMRKATASVDLTRKILMDDDTICTFAKGVMMALAYRMRDMDVDTEDHTRKEIEAEVIAELKDFLLEHPEHNSYAGFAKLKTTRRSQTCVRGLPFPCWTPKAISKTRLG
jgi:hypothetical protein